MLASMPATLPSQTSTFSVPVEYYKLPNGLKVVLSPDRIAPIATIAVYYGVGLRNEPRNRTGFSHLFEHMMFQGSQNLGKNEFINLVQSNGGTLNGSTRLDYTNYFETVPAHTLRTMLWAEADRMRGLAIDQAMLTNQQGVVKNEVRVNVLNQPYGGFPWLDVPQYANTNWHNSHNWYGDLADLDAATLPDVLAFHKTFYAPNNAALVVVGDFEPREARAMIQEYFGNIPSAPQPPEPDLSEPRQEKEKRASKPDAKANRPALAFAYHVPARNTPEFYAMGLIDQILLQGNDSRLRQALVQGAGLTGSVTGGINLLGNMFNYSGPMLWTVALYHDKNVADERILASADSVIERLRTTLVDQATLDRARIKLRSDFYNVVNSPFGRADLLASFALFDDDPARINGIEAEFQKVTPELVRRTATEYLRPTNRTVLSIEPTAATQ
ncbi:MAG TPA: pitrilysin family protein [Gemmatimonadaceae bacterium]|nr:pitrilysin family protein [Gemmatimonadaceae bacterium]